MLFNFTKWIFPIHLYQSNVISSVVGAVGSIASVAGPIASIAGGIMGSSAAGQAAEAQTASSQAAINQQQGMFNTIQGNLKPYYTEGQNALSTLSGNLKSGKLGGQFTNADLNANMAPNYAFQLQQGQQALQNSQAAQDGVMSGAAQKQMQNYVQGTAAGAYQQAYNNWQSSQNMQYNQLSNLVGIGENAAAQVGNNGAQLSNSIANSQIGIGNAQAGAAIGSANAISNGVNNAAGYLSLNSMLNGASTTSAPSSGLYSVGGGSQYDPSIMSS